MALEMEEAEKAQIELEKLEFKVTKISDVII